MGSDRLGLRVVLVLGAVLLLTQQMVAEGVVLLVSWQQNALLLQTAEGFSLVAVDPRRRSTTPLAQYTPSAIFNRAT